MRFNTALLCFSILAVVGIGLFGIIEERTGDIPTGMTIQKRLIKKAPAFQKYCHGWENGNKACFDFKGNLKAFECKNYYWIPSNDKAIKCCIDYFDCVRTGIFRMPSYCNQNKRMCQTR